MEKFDKIDEKIIKELDLNPRISLTKLAKKTRISQQVADYRIKRMMKEGFIVKFGTIINLKALGQEHYRIFFTFYDHKKYSNNLIFNYLKKRKGVYWTARIGGKYDLHVTLFVFDFDELEKFIDDFNKEFSGLVKDYLACYVLEHLNFRHKYLGSSGTIKYGYKDKINKIDNLDKIILNKIKDNCRLSSLEIANNKVSYKTVINRIKSLEKNGIILGYRIYLKSNNIKPFIILVSYKNYSKVEEKGLIDYLENHKNITQLLRLFGTWNLFIHARIKNMEKLQEVIIDIRNKFEIIDNIEIIPIFEDITINLMPI